MNKIYESNLKLNIKLNWKITNHTPNHPMCGCKSFQKANDQPIAVWEVKLN
jgi:hypothetical protein